MASFGAQLIFPYATLGPNATSGWWTWNTSPIGVSRTFHAAPHSLGEAPSGTWLTAEVVNVGASLQVGSGGKRQFRFRVKNTSPYSISYEVHQSWIAP